MQYCVIYMILNHVILRLDYTRTVWNTQQMNDNPWGLNLIDNNTHPSRYIDGFTWYCGNSIADTLELPQSCVKPSIWYDFMHFCSADARVLVILILLRLAYLKDTHSSSYISYYKHTKIAHHNPVMEKGWNPHWSTISYTNLYRNTTPQ